MNRSPSFPPFRGSGRKTGSASAARGATDYLRADDRMAALLPAVARISALQKDCAAILPALFGHCSVLRYEAGQVVLAAPNAALASKLKQQLPKLQDALLKRAWQVSAIKIKVQVGNVSTETLREKHLSLPGSAFSALDALQRELDDTPSNAALKGALGAMLRRHRPRTQQRD